MRLLCEHSGLAIISFEKRENIGMFIVFMCERNFSLAFTVLWVGLQSVIVATHRHTDLPFYWSML